MRYAVAFVVLGVLFSLTFPWTIYADSWEQIAAMLEISRNPLHPLHHLLQLPGDTSVRFTPYTVFWGIVARLLGWSMFELFPVVSAVNLTLVVTGLWRLATGYSENRWLPIVWVAIMLWMWGSGYAQSNAYQFGTMLHTAPYVAMFAYGLGFHALASLGKYLRCKRTIDLAIYAVLTVVTFLSHPITAAFVIVAAGAMLLPTKSVKLIVGLQAVPVICLLVALAWPYFSYWKLLTNGSTANWFVPKNESLIAILGPALGGLYVVALFIVKRRHPFVIFGVLICAFIYVVSDFLKILIGGRFVLFGTIFLHLALALYIVEDGQGLLRGLRNRRASAILGLAFLALLVVWGARYRQREVRKVFGDIAHWVSSGFSAYGSDIQSLVFLEGKLTPSDIVLAPSDYGLILPVITGAKVVAHIHGNPLMNDELQARCAAADSFYTLRSKAVQRETLERYSVTHVFCDLQADTWPEALGSDLLEYPVAKGERFALYEVAKDAE